jgi:hypothetical protein
MESLPAGNGVESKGLLEMFTTHHLAVRLLIWLAAIATPLQGLPTATCGCSDSRGSRDTSRHAQCGCCSASAIHGKGCCSPQTEDNRSPCCSPTEGHRRSSCQCGVNCRCGEQPQPVPATPAGDHDSGGDKTGFSATSTPICAAISPLGIAAGRVQLSIEAISPSALERCIFLCRFTL